MTQTNILLTGASKGLGLEIAKSIIGKGWRVVAINRTCSAELEQLKKKYPNLVRVIQFDLSDTSEIRDRIFKEELGLRYPIHGLVNNAALAYDDIITNVNLDSLEQMYQVNVFSPFILTKYVIRSMLLNRITGSIIHVSSISVHTGYKGLAMYASTKGALEAFSKNTAREWGGRGIRSNCVVAGFMETNMSAALSDSQKKRVYKRASLKIPTAKTSVAETLTFLLSEDACSITGQNIFVDSGTI